MYRHSTKASQTAELKLPKYQTSSTPPQVTNPAQLTTYRSQQPQSLGKKEQQAHKAPKIKF